MQYSIYSEDLTVDAFLKLVEKVWPGNYNEERAGESLKKTHNITAWHKNELIGCVRLLSDGYFFSTITEILVDPIYQKRGVGKKLMELAYQESPSNLSFGVQPGNEAFFEKLGYEKGLRSYQKKKERN